MRGEAGETHRHHSNTDTLAPARVCLHLCIDTHQGQEDTDSRGQGLCFSNCTMGKRKTNYVSRKDLPHCDCIVSLCVPFIYRIDHESTCRRFTQACLCVSVKDHPGGGGARVQPQRRTASLRRRRLPVHLYRRWRPCGGSLRKVWQFSEQVSGCCKAESIRWMLRYLGSRHEAWVETELLLHKQGNFHQMKL